MQDSGEGRWTIEAAIEEAVPADVLTASLYARFRSRQEHTFAEKLLSAMRKQFGGHVGTEVGPGASAHGQKLETGHPAAQPPRRPVRGGHLRRLGRPDQAEAHPGAVQPAEQGFLPKNFAVVGRGADAR